MFCQLFEKLFGVGFVQRLLGEVLRQIGKTTVKVFVARVDIKADIFASCQILTLNAITAK